MLFLLPNSPATFRGFTYDEKLMMVARMRKNQTGIEHRKIKMDQVKETLTDYKTYLFFFLGVVGEYHPRTEETKLIKIGNIPNGGLSNVSPFHSFAADVSVQYASHQRSRLRHAPHQSARYSSRSLCRLLDRLRSFVERETSQEQPNDCLRPVHAPYHWRGLGFPTCP